MAEKTKKKRSRCPKCGKLFINLAAHSRTHQKKVRPDKKSDEQIKPKSKRKIKKMNVRYKKTKAANSKNVHGITQIKVIGVGGAGGNIISRMKDNHKIRGVEYVAINTDAQDLDYTSSHRKVYIGKALTKGLGAGMNPEIGRRAAEESRSEIENLFDDADVVFITAGMGGGTGSGAAPIVAESAKQKGKIVVAIVTKPFNFEGSKRMSIAQEAIAQLQENVDAIVVVPNDHIFSVINKDTPILQAFSFVDDIVSYGVRAVAELINVPGIINVDFADIRSILQNAGPSLIGVGIASGQDRSMKAVNDAVNSPLLESSIDGSKGVLLSIGGGKDLKMSEVNDIAKAVVANLDTNAQVIFGAYHERPLKKNSIKVTVIATGFSGSISGIGPSSIPQLFESKRTSGGASLDDDIVADDDQEELQEEKESIVSKKRPVKTSSKDEPWDIPAFLRKKKR